MGGCGWLTAIAGRFKKLPVFLKLTNTHFFKVDKHAPVCVQDEVDRKRASGCTMEIDPALMTEQVL